jgi:hypothetical protein
MAVVQQQVADTRIRLQVLETDYHQRQRPERPHSKLAKARHQLGVYQRRQERSQWKVDKAEKWLGQRQDRLKAYLVEIAHLQTRRTQFQQDNTQNTNPVTAVFHLDAGFSTAENIALLIELGYEVCTKPHDNWLSGVLRQRAEHPHTWERVGKNAEMVAGSQVQLEDCPYPLDLACQRFWTDKSYLYSGLLHFGDDDVVNHLPEWFEYYNARQTIAAGNKELRLVFEAHHLKVRAAPAL